MSAEPEDAGASRIAIAITHGAPAELAERLSRLDVARWAEREKLQPDTRGRLHLLLAVSNDFATVDHAQRALEALQGDPALGHLRRWIGERTEQRSDRASLVRDLHADFAVWAIERRLAVFSVALFSRRLKALGFVRLLHSRSRRAMVLGLALLQPSAAAAE